jgi:hypothetical protein
VLLLRLPNFRGLMYGEDRGVLLEVEFGLDGSLRTRGIGGIEDESVGRGLKAGEVSGEKTWFVCCKESL